MKSIRFLLTLAAGAAALQAQVFFTVDIKTVAADQSTLATRLYSDAAFTAPLNASSGYNIWFVADTGHNGIPTLNVTPDGLLGADDRILWTDRVDGDQPGSVAGRFRHNGVDVSESVISGGVTRQQILDADVYVVLWNNSSNAFAPVAGSQFGIYNTGGFSVPQIGNAFWGIDGNINSTQFTVVPEPGEYAAMAGGALVAFAVWRRRQQNRA